MNHLWLPAYASILLISLGALLNQEIALMSSEYVLSILILFFTTYIANIMHASWSNKGTLNGESFFVGFFCLFHFSYYFLYSIGMAPYDNEVFYIPTLTPGAVYFCIICILLFIISYRAFPTRTSDLNQPKPSPDKAKTAEMYTLSKYLMAFAILLFWLPIISISHLAFSNYNALIAVGSLSPIGKLFPLAQYIGYCAFSLYFPLKSQTGRSFYSGKSSLMPLAFMFGYLFIGDRGGFISLTIIYVFAYSLFHKKISFKAILISIFSLLTISSFTAAARVESIFNPLSIARYYLESGKSHPIIQALTEFGASLKTVVVAMAYIPNNYDHWNGKSFLDSLMVVLPNFLGNRQSSGPDVFITEIAFGPIDSTYGRGGSIAMEAYLNFGYAGSLLFIIYGIYMKYVYMSAISKRTVFSYMLFFSTLAAFAMWMRNTSSVSFRIVIWSIVILWAISAVTKNRATHTHPRKPAEFNLKKPKTNKLKDFSDL